MNAPDGIVHRCSTCGSEYDDVWAALGCYRSHSRRLAVERVVKGEPDSGEGGVSMTHPKVALNGIDPSGGHPPDEIVHHSGDDDATELIRDGTVWSVRSYKGDELMSETDFVEFGNAFAKFSATVGVKEGML